MMRMLSCMVEQLRFPQTLLLSPLGHLLLKLTVVFSYSMLILLEGRPVGSSQNRCTLRILSFLKGSNLFCPLIHKVRRCNHDRWLGSVWAGRLRIEDLPGGKVSILKEEN